MPVALDSAQTEFDTLGETGGEKTHLLTQAEMPSHTHVQNAHIHNVTFGVGGNPVQTLHENTVDYAPGARQHLAPGIASLVADTNVAGNQNTGGGAAHNNLNPYLVLNFIIKT